MKTTIQKFSVDKNGNKVKATGALNHIRSEALFVPSEGELVIEVDGNSNGHNYMTTMTLKASDTETVSNAFFGQMPGFGKTSLNQIGLWGIFNKKPKKRRYGIEIDSKHFFVIQTVDDLKKLCTFINI